MKRLLFAALLLCPALAMLFVAASALGQQDTPGFQQDTPGFESRMPEPATGRFGVWRVLTMRDPITDHLSYGIITEGRPGESGVGILATGRDDIPGIISVPEHDFPGRELRIRIDDLPGHTLVDGKLTSEILGEILKGKTLLVEYVHWPYDSKRYATISLDGFSEAFKRASAWARIMPRN